MKARTRIPSFAQEGDGAAKVVDGHPLVETGEKLRVDGLEAEGYLEPRRFEQVAKEETGGATETRMILDDQGAKSPSALGDRDVIRARDRATVEKVAAVVELEVLRWRQACERPVDLLRDRARGHGLIRRVAPQVAHRLDAARNHFPLESERRS